jgi:hypothetical protein
VLKTERHGSSRHTPKLLSSNAYLKLTIDRPSSQGLEHLTTTFARFMWMIPSYRICTVLEKKGANETVDDGAGAGNDVLVRAWLKRESMPLQRPDTAGSSVSLVGGSGIRVSLIQGRCPSFFRRLTGTMYYVLHDPFRENVSQLEFRASLSFSLRSPWQCCWLEFIVL